MKCIYYDDPKNNVILEKYPLIFTKLKDITIYHQYKYLIDDAIIQYCKNDMYRLLLDEDDAICLSFVYQSSLYYTFWYKNEFSDWIILDPGDKELECMSFYSRLYLNKIITSCINDNELKAMCISHIFYEYFNGECFYNYLVDKMRYKESEPLIVGINNFLSDCKLLQYLITQNTNLIDYLYNEKIRWKKYYDNNTATKMSKSK